MDRNSYRDLISKNEDELSELKKEERLVNEQRDALDAWKRQELAHADQMSYYFKGSDTAQDRRMLNKELAYIQEVCSKVDLECKEQAGDIRGRQKQNLGQRDSIEGQYRAAQREEN